MALLNWIGLFRSTGPMPVRHYKGNELLKIALDKHGGEEGLLRRLQRQGRMWKVDPLNAPPIRYFILRSDRENLTKSIETGHWRAPVWYYPHWLSG